MKTLIHNNKTIHIISTAHVSKESVIEVKEAIENIQPDVVCVELDRNRANALMNPVKEDMDIKAIIKSKKLTSFVFNLILSSYQKKIADDLDTEVGAEMKQAITSSKEFEIPVHYIDRDISITMNRIWSQFNLWKKVNLAATLIASMFEKEEISEDEVESLKESDLLLESIKELDDSYPEISEVILHERNRFMAQKINNLPYDNIVVVIGAAHAPGMIECLDESYSIAELNKTITKKKSKWSGFIIPGTILALITILTFKSPQMGFQQLLTWIITSSTLAALGALLSGAHVATIVVSFLTAFIGILSPVLAVGIFASLTEAYFRPPFTSDFDKIGDDMGSVKGWYTNRVLRIILVFFMTSILSSIGTFIAGTNVIKSLFS